MNKRIFIVILSVILIINTILPRNVYAETSNRVIKVGLFPLEPYAYFNSEGELDGYYVEFFDLIAERMNVEVEYILSDIKDWLPNLENRNVDIILGASITKDRMEKFIFNKNSIALEGFALYSNKNKIDSVNFENLNWLRFGYIAENVKSQWVFNFFKAISINVVPVVGKDYSELKEFMEDDKIDLMVDSNFSNNRYKKIYEFIGDQVYIAANKESENLLAAI